MARPARSLRRRARGRCESGFPGGGGFSAFRLWGLCGGRSAEGRVCPPPRGAARFVLPPPLSVVVSPYGFDLIGYYRLLLIDPPFKNLIQEWDSPRPTWYTAPLFVLAALTVVFLSFRIRRLPAFEAVLLTVTLGLAMNALHNTVWFGLAALAVLPARVSRPTRVSRTPVGGALALVPIAALVAVC